MNTSQYLTIEILSDGNITWIANNNSIAKTIEYKKNDGDWTSITSTTGGTQISVVSGDTVQFRGYNNSYSSGTYSFNRLLPNCQCNLKGNIMSLINGTTFPTLTTVADYAFNSLFSYNAYPNTNIQDVSNLLLPATTLGKYCYESMFSTNAFTIAPELPATILTEGCYYELFRYNKSLNYIKCLATDVSATDCTNRWIGVDFGITASGTFITPSSTNWSTGTSGIPTNWTRVNYIPFGPELDELEFKYTGGTQSIELTSESPWTATTTSDWITLSQYSGETGGNITVTIAANEFGGARTGTVEFTDGENTSTLTVNQETGEYVIKLSNLYLNGNKAKLIYLNGKRLYVGFTKLVFDVDTESIEFDYEGSTTTINITANDKWTMTLPEWITASLISGSSNASVTLTTTQNPTEDEQTGNIVITCDGKTITIPVKQNGAIGLGTTLTFEIIGDGYINWKAKNSGLLRTIEYNKNMAGWTSITSTTSGVQIPVVSGDTVQFRGDNPYYCDPTSNSYSNSFCGTTCTFNVYGNIMSMVNSSDFKNLNTLSYDRQFRNFFWNCTGLTDASNLFLPATSVTQFCYSSMFDTCTSLTAAPELPATTLANGCYVNMFLRCSNLVTAPVLPAKTLVANCYNAMFHNCSKLNYIECLATSGIGQNNSTYIWVNYVQTSSGTFVKDPSATWSRGTSGVPNNWTIVNKE